MPRYTNDVMIRALEQSKGLVYIAAKLLGCKPDTIYARAKVSQDVKDCLTAQRGEFVDTAELKLNQAVLNSEPWAVALVLKTLGKDRGYVERTEVKRVDDDELNAALETALEEIAAGRQALGARQGASRTGLSPAANGAFGAGSGDGSGGHPA